MNHLDYMYLAGLASLESICKRAQVGAVLAGSFGHVSVDSRWRHGQVQDRYWSLQDAVAAQTAAQHAKSKANADSSI